MFGSNVLCLLIIVYIIFIFVLVLCIGPGTLSNCHMGDNIGQNNSENYNVISIDQRGTGYVVQHFSLSAGIQVVLLYCLPCSATAIQSFSFFPLYFLLFNTLAVHFHHLPTKHVSIPLLTSNTAKSHMTAILSKIFWTSKKRSLVPVGPVRNVVST